jgi:rhodanese-related sulfurtransferase
MDYTIIRRAIAVLCSAGRDPRHSRNALTNQGYDPERGTGGGFRQELRPPGAGLSGRRHL